jgi:exodeoxyribonuclease VII large subunit
VPRQKLDTLAERLPRALKANAEIHHKQYLRCATKLAPQLLHNRIRAERERLSNLGSRTRRCAEVYRDRRRERLANAGVRLTAAVRANIAGHRQRIVRDHERIAALFERGTRAVTRVIERRDAALERAEKLLAAYSYHGVLARGFALVRDARGQPLRAAVQVGAGAALDIEFHDGRVGAVASGAGTPKPAPMVTRARRRRTGGSAEGQGSLF